MLVRQYAQKTDAQQTNRTLLLSRRARMFAKPQLEILADDVKCTHGATIGQIDAEALCYMRSRGLPSDLAKRMLIDAFASEVVEPSVAGGASAWVKAMLQPVLTELASYQGG
ncbi:SufD family Fe-S cluster assembly protein [Planctomycetota bacterium]